MKPAYSIVPLAERSVAMTNHSRRRGLVALGGACLSALTWAAAFMVAMVLAACLMLGGCGARARSTPQTAEAVVETRYAPDGTKTVTEHVKTAGPGATSDGDTAAASVNGKAPGVKTPSISTDGGENKTKTDAHDYASKINLLMVLGALIAAASVAGLFYAPAFKKLCIAGLIAGGVVFALGWLVTGGIAVLIVVGVLAVLACVTVYVVKHGSDSFTTLGKITRAVENAPEPLSDGIKAEIAKHSVNDTVIEKAKKAEGV